MMKIPNLLDTLGTSMTDVNVLLLLLLLLYCQEARREAGLVPGDLLFNLPLLSLCTHAAPVLSSLLQPVLCSFFLFVQQKMFQFYNPVHYLKFDISVHVSNVDMSV